MPAVRGCGCCAHGGSPHLLHVELGQPLHAAAGKAAQELIGLPQFGLELSALQVGELARPAPGSMRLLTTAGVQQKTGKVG